uniref:Protein phosphatase 1, regulatory subunit 26 n=1 Tax=Nothobranchius korthausae TaxID=1143690 RepID=A0A1A8FFB9_9TELE
MYLMNVPPVAATQTEWRRCGPAGGYSFPACFNESDSELSTRGTPISNKVQMIIESLRSTQSSIEMGDEIEENISSGLEGHTQARRVPVGSDVGAKSKTKSAIENPQTNFPSINSLVNSDTDSDDSVDRGIEEAILEYLKEKDGHKRKAEPCSHFLQSSKIPRKDSPLLEVSKQNSDGNTSLISISQFQTSVNVEPSTAQAGIPLKKYIKNKASLDDNFDLSRGSCSVVISKEQKNDSSEMMSIFPQTMKFPVTVKVEEELDDSSSDDGIEEAIQRYQLEQKEQQSKKEPFSLSSFQDESDSTSDDGIEEAIRSYQLEQLREKSGLKSFLHKQKPCSNNALIQAVGSASSENMKKHKLKKKKSKSENQLKISQSHPSSDLKPKSSLLNIPKDKGNGLISFKVEHFREQPTPAPPKVNTTAELMCAEAILDISKTVMPGPFHQEIGFSAIVPTGASTQPSLPDSKESNDSSVDSEDGIEQEIRKFLAQKAQMHQQLPNTPEPGDVKESEKVKAKEFAVQKKTQKLSLTQRRKQREHHLLVSSVWGTDNRGKDTASKSDCELAKESNLSALSQSSQTQPDTTLHRTEQSGEKSSSLDSDEDLDTAIKDLLQTKKKSKKKVRDMKKKSSKCIKAEEPMSGISLSTQMLKSGPVYKFCALKKVSKSKDGVKDECRLLKMNVSQLKQIAKSTKQPADIVAEAEFGDAQSLHASDTLPQIKDDSSSVDSDDSIELEIRKFLAEKAKVLNAEQRKDEDVCRNGTVMVQQADLKQETQLAECPSRMTGLPSASLSRSPEDQISQRLLPEVSSITPPSHTSSVQSCSSSLLEPADGAGATKNQQKRPDDDVTSQMDRSRPVSSPATAQSQSIKWRQSLGLPISDQRAPTRTLFHITSSENKETASATLSYPNRDLKLQTPASTWFSSRTGRVPFSFSSETAVNATARPPVLKFFSSARQQSQMTFTQSLTPSHRSPFPLEEEKASTVHMPKDKSVFVELESNRTNHVQVQSRDRGEGKERADSLNERKAEGKSSKIDNEEVHQDRKDEEFIDESDCESDSRRDPGKKQGFAAL